MRNVQKRQNKFRGTFGIGVHSFETLQNHIVVVGMGDLPDMDTDTYTDRCDVGEDLVLIKIMQSKGE